MIYNGKIEFLPACAPECKKGSVKGLRTRNRVVVEHFEWDIVTRKAIVRLTAEEPVIIVKRIRNEEAVLEKELEGYMEYKKKVKYRLIPLVW